MGAMSRSAAPFPPELELRPKTLAGAMLRRFGESDDEARHRLRTVALPAAAGLVIIQGFRSYRGAQEDGLAREAVLLGTALLVGAILVGILFLAHVRQRVTVEGDQLVVRTLLRTRRHARSAVHDAVSIQLQEPAFTVPATFVLDDAGRCLVALSWQHWDPDDVGRLLAHLRLPHADRTDEQITLRQMQRSYPGAFTFSRRRPWATGCLVTIAIIAAIIPIAVYLAS